MANRVRIVAMLAGAVFGGGVGGCVGHGLLAGGEVTVFGKHGGNLKGAEMLDLAVSLWERCTMPLHHAQLAAFQRASE